MTRCTNMPDFGAEPLRLALGDLQDAAPRIAALRPLAAELRQAGYRMDRVWARIGIQYRSWQEGNPDAAGLSRYLAAHRDEKLDRLILFFLLNQPVQPSWIREALPGGVWDGLPEAGLLAWTAPDQVRARFSLFEIGGLYVLTDGLLDSFAGHGPMDSVMPLYPESYELAAAALPGPFHDVLDLCTGSGVHALLAARRSVRVVGCDNNPRAVSFARLNAAVNGVSNADFRLGDLFEPVEGEAFDLILANPPYMPDPELRPGDTCYAGGPIGESICARIYAGADRHLRPGGFLQVLQLFPEWPGSTFADRLARYLGGQGGYRVALSSAAAEVPVEFAVAPRKVEFGVATLHLPKGHQGHKGHQGQDWTVLRSPFPPSGAWLASRLLKEEVHA